MMNVWLGVLTFYIVLSGFFFSYRLSGVNRTFLLLPKGIIENSVVIIDQHTFEKPFFDITYLEEKTKDYFTINLDKYVSSYALSFFYFDTDGNEDFFNQHYDGVSIALKTKITGEMYYENSLTFTIKNHAE